LKKEALMIIKWILPRRSVSCAEVLENSIENYKHEIVNSFSKSFTRTIKKAIFLGRHISYPFALEASFKA